MPNDELSNKQLTQQEIIAIRLFYKAMKKTDARDIELIINRMDGLLMQRTEISGKEILNIDFKPMSKEEINKAENIEINDKTT